MDWLKNISAAIDYIENNLDKEISYDKAASLACCSTYYFQRLFSYISGVSLSEYIRRRRMTQAAFELQRTECKVIDVTVCLSIYSILSKSIRRMPNVISHGRKERLLHSGNKNAAC